MASPVIPWIGSKRRLAKHLLPLFPEHDCYVEPFCGAAALFFLKEPSKVEVLNDINGDVVNLYRVIQHHLDEFVRMFRWALVSRVMFCWMRETPVDTLTDIQRAARFFYLQRLAFGGKVDGQTFGISTTSTPKLNLLRIEEDLSVAHLRLSRATIEHLDWAECFARYDRPRTLLYCDPPYPNTEGYGVPFESTQYDRMAGLARSAQGRVVISVSDTPQMRKVFSGLRKSGVGITYTVGGARRPKAARELIVRNW